MITYEHSPEVETHLQDIARRLGMAYLDFSRIACVISKGSKSRRTLARCHAMSRIFHKGFGIRPHYVVEIVSENFFKQPREEQVKTLIHELMHIPKSLGGGFRHHSDHVSRRNVDSAYKQLIQSYKL